MNKVERVDALMFKCLNGVENGALVVKGIVQTYGFSSAKIAEHKEEIRALLNEMPPAFHKSTGGGWSFLQLCMDKDGNQWGEHRNMEALVCLGIAAGLADYTLPREMWSAFPGGMPYVTFDT